VARLTEEVSRRWGGAATRCSGVRQRPRRREGRRQLRLALGPAGEDEGGDGGPKTENDGGLGGSHRGGGGDGDGGVRQRKNRGGERRFWHPRHVDRVTGGRERQRRA
jgi:hypothetical protein